jgi:hypothetical protein
LADKDGNKYTYFKNQDLYHFNDLFIRLEITAINARKIVFADQPDFSICHKINKL